MTSQQLHAFVELVKQFELIDHDDRLVMIEGLHAYFSRRDHTIPTGMASHPKKWIKPTTRVINGKLQKVRGYWAATRRGIRNGHTLAAS